MRCAIVATAGVSDFPAPFYRFMVSVLVIVTVFVSDEWARASSAAAPSLAPAIALGLKRFASRSTSSKHSFIDPV
jgi:hypothetical protein